MCNTSQTLETLANSGEIGSLHRQNKVIFVDLVDGANSGGIVLV